MNLLGLIFADAIDDGVLEKNPAKSRKIVMPSTKKTEREALSVDDVRKIIAELALLEERDRRMMALLLLTGMRRGEVLGLRWEDIDVNNGLIHVQRNVTYAQNQPHVGTPKTQKGFRDIPLDSTLLNLLQPAQKNGYIVGGETPISNMSYKRAWERIAKQIDLHEATAHVFRHTYLTIASNAGVSIKTLQAIGGHADISTTMNRYVHAQVDQIRDAGVRISQEIHPICDA